MAIVVTNKAPWLTNITIDIKVQECHCGLKPVVSNIVMPSEDGISLMIHCPLYHVTVRYGVSQNNQSIIEDNRFALDTLIRLWESKIVNEKKEIEKRKANER